MTTRRTSSILPKTTRNSAAVRRAPMAPASVMVRFDDAKALDVLVGHLWRRARGEKNGLSSYRWSLRQRGRGELVSFVMGAVNYDGGGMFRRLTKAAEGDARDLVKRAVSLFVRQVAEHEVRSTGALAMLFRASLQAVVLDDVMVRLATGKASAEDGKLLSLDASARLNTATALQLAREARAENGGRAHEPALEAAAARLAARHAEVVEVCGSPDEAEGGAR